MLKIRKRVKRRNFKKSIKNPHVFFLKDFNIFFLLIKFERASFE